MRISCNLEVIQLFASYTDAQKCNSVLKKLIAKGTFLVFPISYYRASYYLLPCFLLSITVFFITESTISGRIKNLFIYFCWTHFDSHCTMKLKVVTVCIITFMAYFQRVRCLPPNPLATADYLDEYNVSSINFTLLIWENVNTVCRLLNIN